MFRVPPPATRPYNSPKKKTHRCSGCRKKNVCTHQHHNSVPYSPFYKSHACRTDLATPEQTRNLYLTLLTILFAYTFDARTTQHDPTPESAWTLCTLVPAFSALDPPPYDTLTTSPAQPAPPTTLTFTPSTLHSTVVASLRRTLAFPLYRSVALSSKCIADVATILLHGKRAVLRALLAAKRILDAHDVYYVYSKVWVDDFCRWTARDARCAHSFSLLPPLYS